MPVSTKFPEGNGDFQIKSSDGLICYFPKALLAYLSPVFHDILTIPVGGQNASTSPDIVDVTEPGISLELFLEYLDPVRIKPPIDPRTIDAILDMADKYQVNMIIKWFENEVTMQQMHGTGDVTRRPMLLTNPRKVLQIAQQFHLENLTRLALKELLPYKLERIISPSNPLDRENTANLLRLREERINKYYGWIETLAKPKRTVLTLYGFGGVRVEEEVYNDNSKNLAACIQCTSNRATWVLGMMQAVRESPKWESFEAAFNNEKVCENCSRSWREHFAEDFKTWEWEARECEDIQSLPGALNENFDNWQWLEIDGEDIRGLFDMSDED